MLSTLETSLLSSRSADSAKPHFLGDSFVDMLVQIAPMDSTHYSITQLLAIRGSKLQTSLERKLLDESKGNPVLMDILRQKHLGRNRRLPFLPRNNMELRKSFSTESEGHDQIKPQAPQITAPVRDKTTRQTVRHTVGDVSQLDGQAGRQLDGQDAEPDIPPEAPQRPVLPDQKRKGFEQFYEAVRSPTHVRVTAGGRIVPNTLEASHSSPTGKGNRERLVGDVNGAQLPLGQTFNGNPFLPGPPLMGPMHPTMHSAFSMMTTGPSPMSPFGGFAMPPFALPQIPSQTAFSHPTGVGNPAGNLEDNKEHENSAAPTSAPLPMPPLGGQWFIPPHSMMPMGMPFPGGPIMPMAFNPMGQPMLYPQPLQPVPATGVRSFSPAVQTEGCPASSIRPSIITKNQLAGLRSSLKKAEAQLAYNRHQIDEKHMEEYARQLRSDIEHFEIKLKGELALEDNTLPQRNDMKDKSDSNVSKASKFATDSCKILLSSTVDSESINETVGNATAKTTTEEQKASKSRKRDRVRLAVDTSMASAPFINNNIFATISPVPFDPNGQQQQQESDHVRKPSTGLPVSAARAPVFQPRLDLHRPSENTPPVSALMNGEQDTRGTRFHGPIPTNFEESRLLSSIAPPTPAHDMEGFSNFARDNAGLGLPYLIGEIPFGMDPSPDLRDYIYHRPLNQDEEMAKHLFWTNAPEHLRQKFPKFNGKDFYPVSPEKMPRPSIISSNLPTGRPEQDFGFTPPTVDLDPFAPLEPYRGDLLRKPTLKEKESRDMKRDTKSDNVTSPMKRRSKLRPVAYFNSQGLDESKQSSGSSENVETDSERAYFNSCVRTWSERVTAAATALPGAVTSENALGYLPQYAIGNAAASLSPAIAKAANQSK